jgi:surface protein
VIVLITNNHVIDKNYLSKNTEIKYIIENNGQEEKRVISLRLKRLTISNEELDATIIEILDEDNIENFFEVDEAFIKNKNLKDEKIFSIQYLKGQELNLSFGKILNCYDSSIEYDIGTSIGSSGSPIISLDGNKIIALHKGGWYSKKNKEKKNLGTILDKIIELIPQSYYLKHNVIKCTYYIKKEDLNKDIKLYHNSNNISEKIKEVIIQREGEKGEILRNGIYQFNKEGKYFLKYKFDDSLNDLSCIFYDCSSLTGVFIPSFPKNKITDLSKAFEGCLALKNIHFSFSFNTKDVKDMLRMFKNCQSLEYINLSSFNTKNVQDMSSMFEYCLNLQIVDLSSFNTKCVEDMSSIFSGCTK